MTGIEHISQAFSRAHQQGRAALMPYFTLGFPDPQVSLEIITAIAHSGADLIELGVPFSDPLADGPTIQHSTQVALSHQVTFQHCLEMAAKLRSQGVNQPLLLMTYYNPLLSYGIHTAVDQAVRAGVDGLIVPDLPVEEAETLEIACREAGLALVFLIAPTSPPARIELLAKHTIGFVYLVSLTGVTGARDQLASGLEDLIQKVRRETSLPIAVGFGISTPDQAHQVGKLADGVIVGSALIRAVGESKMPAQAAREFTQSLLAGLSSKLDKQPSGTL